MEIMGGVGKAGAGNVENVTINEFAFNARRLPSESCVREKLRGVFH